MKRLTLVRHGETVWNASKILQGQSDIDLSERGIVQVKNLKRVIDQMRPDVVITSDLLRASHTAALLGYSHAKSDTAWREADLGQWTGRDAHDLIRLHPQQYQQWRDGKACPPGGEAFEDFKRRIAKALAALPTEASHVMVVTHGGVIRAALSHLIGLHPDRLIGVHPASATVLDMSAAPRLMSYNQTAYTDHIDTTD